VVPVSVLRRDIELDDCDEKVMVTLDCQGTQVQCREALLCRFRVGGCPQAHRWTNGLPSAAIQNWPCPRLRSLLYWQYIGPPHQQ
jgi:hypothetical protein